MLAAALADLLTGSRILMGVSAAAALATGHLNLFNILLTTAWATDVFDGRLARLSTRPTIFAGPFDMIVDTWVGACVIVGFGLSDRFPLWFAVGAIVVLGAAYLATRNPAVSQVLQAIAYGSSLWLIYVSDDTTLAIPLITLAVLMAMEYKKFFGKVLPMFFHGVAAVVKGEPYHGPEDLKNPDEARHR